MDVRRPVGTQLSDREVEVAQLVALGLSNLQIGKRLYLSENTVKTTLRHAFQRTGARSRAQLVLVLLRRGRIQ